MSVESQQDEIFGKAYDFMLMKRMWHFIAPYQRVFWLSLLLLPFQQAFGLAQPYIMKVTIDRFIGGSNLQGLGIAGVLFAVAVIGEMVTHYFQYYVTMSVAQKSLVY